jgi:hypothetical protein
VDTGISSAHAPLGSDVFSAIAAGTDGVDARTYAPASASTQDGIMTSAVTMQCGGIVTLYSKHERRDMRQGNGQRIDRHKGKGVVVETDNASLSVGLWCAFTVNGHLVGTVE